jgi:hypothetical protein
MANEFLRRSKGNPRYDNKDKVNTSAVDRYAADMRGGHWDITSQGISFNEDGVLVDGHHRMRAIIMANVPVVMYVTWDVPNESFVYDRGIARTTNQILIHSMGESKRLSGTFVVSIIKTHIMMTRGRAMMRAMTDYEAANFIRRYESALNSVIEVTASKKVGVKNVKKASFGHCIFSAIVCGEDMDRIGKFCDIVRTGFYDDNSECAAIIAKRYAEDQARKSPSEHERIVESTYYQTCLWDYLNGIPRKAAYKKTRPYFTDRMVERGL